MEYDAFTAGIELGGLRTRSDIKLLICYLLSSLKHPLTQEMIVESLQSEGLANYFEVCEAIADLNQLGNIQQVEGGYTSTQDGRRVASVLEASLPITVREKAYKAAIRLLTRIKIEQENKVEITKEPVGYSVDCHVLDGEREMMRVTIQVADQIQADYIKKQFLDNPALIYKGVLALFTGHPEAVGAEELFHRKADENAEKTV